MLDGIIYLGYFPSIQTAKHQTALGLDLDCESSCPSTLPTTTSLLGPVHPIRHTDESAFNTCSCISHTLYINHIRALLGPQLNAMSANSSVSLASKNACNPSQTPSPSQSQSGSSIGIEGHTQRRIGGSGSFGIGSTSRSISSTARNNQSLKKQHKGQRRPRLADEDAAAESVSQNPHS